MSSGHPHTLIIAEAGVNHNGSLELALRLVDAAADAGADYIKFQTFKAERLVAAGAKKAEYQMANCGSENDSQLSMLKALELTDSDFRKIAEHCRLRGIGFMSTPFDMESADALSTYGMDFWKIPSGEITNLPFLRKIGSFGSPIILSTGMSTLEEVEDAIEILENSGTPRSKIILLHCTTQYPAPYDSVNLLAMDSLKSLKCRGVGYSDHTRGVEVSLAAVSLGADVIEKHFTLDRSLPGPDHRASLEPDELSRMVSSIRHIEAALGSSKKVVSYAESANIPVARKSIVAAKSIKKGETFSEENLTTKRPGTGLSPMLWDKVIGRVAERDYLPDDLITEHT